MLRTGAERCPIYGRHLRLFYPVLSAGEVVHHEVWSGSFPHYFIPLKASRDARKHSRAGIILDKFFANEGYLIIVDLQCRGEFR
jgi:hypothetical protein